MGSEHVRAIERVVHTGRWMTAAAAAFALTATAYMFDNFGVPVKDTLCEQSRDVVAYEISEKAEAWCGPDLDGPALASGSFSLEGFDEIGDIRRLNANRQNRERAFIDRTTGKIAMSSVTRIYMTGLTGGKAMPGGYYLVTTPDGLGYDLSQVEFETALPETDTDPNPEENTCNDDPSDPEWRGCYDIEHAAGFFQGMPGIGSDNRNDLPAALAEVMQLYLQDIYCPFNYVFAPEIAKVWGVPEVTPHQVMETFFRSNVRKAALYTKGIAPQRVAVQINQTSLFEPGQSIERAYAELLASKTGIPDDLPIINDHCNGVAQFEANLAVSLDLIDIAYMGAERVPDGYNPYTGEVLSRSHSDYDRFKAPEGMY